MVEFARTEYSKNLIQEMLPIFADHFEQIAHYKDIKLDPDFEVYANCWNAGMLRIFTARNEGELCGYAVFFVRSNPHYKASIQATQDILFLTKAMRTGLTGFKFIKWCDDQLREDGVQAVYHHVKVARDFGKVLERIGYKLVDLIYSRRLD